MLVPVRCFSCGKVIGHLWEDYKKRIGKGEKPDKVLDSLGLERYCCRRMLLSQRDYIDEIIKYKK
jgi:DNA-directed RNA polymerase subunit N